MGAWGGRSVLGWDPRDPVASELTPSSLAQRRRPARPGGIALPRRWFLRHCCVSQGLGGFDILDPSLALPSPHFNAPSLCP